MSAPEANKSTKDKIKEMFLSGQILTSCGAAKDFVTADLRKYISVLKKKEGMDIVDRWVESSTGKGCKEYFLRQFTPKEEIVNQPAEITPDLSAIPIPAPVVPVDAKDIPMPLMQMQEEQEQKLKTGQGKLF